MAGVHVMRHEVKYEMVVVLHFYLLWNEVHWNSLSSYCILSVQRRHPWSLPGV
jgi:hypothetical protein